jgi:hypothetical protein
VQESRRVKMRTMKRGLLEKEPKKAKETWK